MDPQAFVELVLEDEGLTGDLDEAAATCLIEQLTIAVKSLVAKASDEDEAGTMVAKARKNGRALARIAAHFQDGDTDQSKQEATGLGWTWPTKALGSASDLILAMKMQLLS
jgi:hypothetical protein